MPRFGNVNCNRLHAAELEVDTLMTTGLQATTTDTTSLHTHKIELASSLPDPPDQAVLLMEANRVTVDHHVRDDDLTVPGDSDLVTKKFVTDLAENITLGVLWLEPVDEIAHLPLVPDPIAWCRVIAEATENGFTVDRVYEWVTDAWVLATIPQAGMATLLLSDSKTRMYLDPPGALVPGWYDVGITIDHEDLLNIGTLTHGTIDSYLDQAVTQASSPQFLSLAVGPSALQQGILAVNAVDGDLELSTSDLFNSGVRILNTQQSNDPTTGALVLSGGLGVTGDFWLTGTANTGNTTQKQGVSGGTLADGTEFQAFKWWHSSDVNQSVVKWVWNQTNTSLKLINAGAGVMSGILIDPTTTISTLKVGPVATSSLFAITGGNLEITTNTPASKSVKILNTTNSTTHLTGALVSSGGIGATGYITIGGHPSYGLTVRPADDDNKFTLYQSPTGCKIEAHSGAYVPEFLIAHNSHYGTQRPITLRMDNLYSSVITGTVKLITSNSGNLTIDSSGGETSFDSTDVVKVLNTTAATTHTAAAFTVAGGVGITGSAIASTSLIVRPANDSNKLIMAVANQGSEFRSYTSSAGPDIHFTNISTYASQVPVTIRIENADSVGTVTGTINLLTTNTGNLTIDSGGDITSIHSSDIFKVLNTTDSTTIADGALVVAGGVGVAKKIIAGGIIKTTDSTESTSISTGSIVASGGAGFAKKVTADHFVQAGANTYWEDLQLIGQARVGGTAPAFSAYDVTGIYMWHFSASANNELHFVTQLPHSCTGLIVPHIHITGTYTTVTAPANVMTWQLAIIIWKANSPTQLYQTITDAKDFVVSTNVGGGSQQFNFDQIDLSNYGGVDYRPSGLMAVRLTRFANDPTDTFPEVAVLAGFDFHYSVGQLGGSATSYP